MSSVGDKELCWISGHSYQIMESSFSQKFYYASLWDRLKESPQWVNCVVLDHDFVATLCIPGVCAQLSVWPQCWDACFQKDLIWLPPLFTCHWYKRCEIDIRNLKRFFCTRFAGSICKCSWFVVMSWYGGHRGSRFLVKLVVAMVERHPSINIALAF